MPGEGGGVQEGAVPALRAVLPHVEPVVVEEQDLRVAGGPQPCVQGGQGAGREEVVGVEEEQVVAAGAGRAGCPGPGPRRLLWGCRSGSTLGSAAATSSTTAADPSGEQSSTAMSSRSAYRCPSTDSRHART